ncbi:hypothetical protein [Phosphitispora sp. TUW77]|uniref:hypothetical protein n=1 Tax=Phosphitispora sp. TUW77 TaxID=3152361 RepID=UPI003AB8BAED
MAIRKRKKDSKKTAGQMEEKLDHKMQAPPEFVPTELGSAVFASIDGSPADEEFLITDNESDDDIEDGAAHSSE